MVPSRYGNKETGAQGEDIACLYLQSKGYRIVGRNYRRRTGEIDIIAEKGAIVHIVEVKAGTYLSRENISREKASWDPAEHATAEKLQKVARTALLYMAEHNDSRQYQVDVLAVYLDLQRKRAICVLFEQVLGD